MKPKVTALSNVQVNAGLVRIWNKWISQHNRDPQTASTNAMKIATVGTDSVLEKDIQTRYIELVSILKMKINTRHRTRWKAIKCLFVKWVIQRTNVLSSTL